MTTSLSQMNTIPHRQRMVVFGGTLLAMMLSSLDQTIVTTALPTITAEFGGINHLAWVVTSYLLATTASAPLWGKLGDLYGRKRLFEASILIFLGGSVLCGISQSMGQLIAFRAVQGLGGGGLVVLAMATIADIIPPRDRGKYSGYGGAVFGASSITGPLLGGFLTDNISWRWVFYINIPLGAIALFIIATAMPATSRRGNPKVDYVGAGLLAALSTGIVLVSTWGGSEYAWGSPTIIGLCIGVLVVFWALLIVERRAEQPIVPLHLFRMTTFRVATSVTFVVGVAMFAILSFLPLFLQVVKGADATNSGFLLMPQTLGLLVSSILSGRAISRTGHYRIYPIVGTGIGTVVLFLLSTMDSTTQQSTVTIYMIVFGLGMGLIVGTMILAVQNAVDPADLGVGTSSILFFRSTGGALGVALFGAVFNALLFNRIGVNAAVGEGAAFGPQEIQGLPTAARTEYVDAFADSLTTVFLFAAPLMFAAFVMCWFLREVPLRAHLAGDEDGATEESASVSVVH